MEAGKNALRGTGEDRHSKGKEVIKRKRDPGLCQGIWGQETKSSTCGLNDATEKEGKSMKTSPPGAEGVDGKVRSPGGLSGRKWRNKQAPDNRELGRRWSI